MAVAGTRPGRFLIYFESSRLIKTVGTSLLIYAINTSDAQPSPASTSVLESSPMGMRNIASGIN
jgi:hypothetical protein